MYAETSSDPRIKWSSRFFLSRYKNLIRIFLLFLYTPVY
jgi:hypothetical protein